MDESPGNQTNQESPPEVKINEQQLNLLNSQIQSEQNLALAVFGGLAAAVVGAGVWAMITALTSFQIGWMAVGVGFLVGFSVRYFGKGVDQIYGIIGAVFALLGCLTGNFLTVVYFVSVESQASFWSLLVGVDLTVIFNVIVETFEFIDLIFYGIAVYEGYRISFRKMTEQELKQITQM